MKAVKEYIEKPMTTNTETLTKPAAHPWWWYALFYYWATIGILGVYKMSWMFIEVHSKFFYCVSMGFRRYQGPAFCGHAIAVAISVGCSASYRYGACVQPNNWIAQKYHCCPANLRNSCCDEFSVPFYIFTTANSPILVVWFVSRSTLYRKVGSTFTLDRYNLWYDRDLDGRCRMNTPDVGFAIGYLSSAANLYWSIFCCSRLLQPYCICFLLSVEW